MGQCGGDDAPHLLLILPSGGVQGLDQSCGVANKNSIASSSDDHAQHGEPDIGQALRGLSTVTDAQHVAHRFEYGEGVQLGPGVVLQGDKKKQLKKADVGVSGDKSNPTATSLGSQRSWKFTQMRTLGTEPH